MYFLRGNKICVSNVFILNCFILQLILLNSKFEYCTQNILNTKC